MLSRNAALIASTFFLQVSQYVVAENTAVAPATETTEAAKLSKPDKNTWLSEKRKAALHVQLFLDEKGFGPGKIDGRWGGFSEKAAKRWNASTESGKIKIADDNSLDLAAAAELPRNGDLLTTYKISDADQELLGALPDGPEEKSKLKELPYTSLMEVVAEKFHADPDFIREINGLDHDSDLSVGGEIKVPNVAEPFDIAEPMRLAKESGEKDELESEDDGNTKDSKPVELSVLREQRIVEVRRDRKLIHSFPISPGASDNQSPAGKWKVSVISWMPEFRWDKSMLEDGKRSDDSFMLPPGPNNPVGIVWIGLDADGIGLHGTPFPDAIGRNQSHGCIRLANWDALKLSKAVEKGTSVVIK